MASGTKFNQFVQDLATGKHNLNSDTLKIALANTAPVATNAVFADVTEISAGNGYSAGGGTATFSSGAQTSGTYKLVLADVTTTASGAVGPFRYSYMYNFTQSSPVKPLICFWDYGSSITLASGDVFTVDLDQSGGVLTIA